MLVLHEIFSFHDTECKFYYTVFYKSEFQSFQGFLKASLEQWKKS